MGSTIMPAFCRTKAVCFRFGIASSHGNDIDRFNSRLTISMITSHDRQLIKATTGHHQSRLGHKHRQGWNLSMRHLIYAVCLTLIALLVSAKQHPLSAPSSPSSRQPFSAIGIVDVGVGPKYREYKRYLPIYPLTSLHTTLHHGNSLNIRSLPRNTTQHSTPNREAIAHAITQSRLAKYTAQSPVIPWTTKEILVPDVTDLITVTTLAQIANNAYIEIPRTLDWIDVDGAWNLTSDFGWEKNGLRGHVFASEGNETIIISLKGTSPAVFLGGGTGGNDKINVSS